ncbi:MAG: hypothetical protein PHW52_01520 [Candidatus Pacebacteria bacterium]|nr:hypothetical protein [Candidatus Paceibacterota bacterium]
MIITINSSIIKHAIRPADSAMIFASYVRYNEASNVIVAMPAKMNLLLTLIVIICTSCKIIL